ncbi:hypothetical protein DV736_g3518, partial [Chaetothyriales sp. CBS 134916]
MAPPDLNSLPPSRSAPVTARAMQVALATDADHQGNPLLRPRRSSTSLAAAASMNAADLSRRSSASNRGSPRPNRMGSERRRSQIAMNLSLNDPVIPGPGELSSSGHSHGQTLSALSPLGEIHNELEQEQEAQVNRMLQMIRDQQSQLDALRSSQPGDHLSRRSSQANSAAGAGTGTTAAVDPLTPASERSIGFPSPHPAILPGQAPMPPRRSLSRNPSSANPSPGLRPIHGNDVSSGVDLSPSPLDIARRNSTRDESSFYQAETAALTRENQLLRQRIRELEKQVSELTAATPNSPPTPSNLATARPVEGEEDEGEAAGQAAELKAPG